MRVFVVGATGVLGQRVVPSLLERGHAVTGVGRSPERLAALARRGMKPAPLDIFDATAVRRAMEGHDAVVNLATHVPANSRMFLPGAWKEMDHVRRDGSAVLADAAIATGIARFVQESFALIYPDSGDRWITEETAPNAARYNRSVLDAERSAARITAAGGTAVALRFALLYGPGDAFAQQVLATVRRGWMPFFGRPDGYVSLVTQEDAAAAVVAALGVPNGIYNVIDDEPLTRADLADALAKLLGVKTPRFLPRWVAKLGGSLGETLARSERISNRKLRTASDWAPRSPSAREGFRRVLDAERKQARAA
jgi:nucleoside-diphosphate-sugar epimerase